MTPALFATVAANAAEKVAPDVTLVDVSMIGAAGRVYMSGTTAGYRPRARRDHARAARDVRGTRPDEHRTTCPPRRRRAARAGRAARARRVRRGARGGLTLLNVSENATYAVDDPATGERDVLRVHRHGYHDGAADRVRARLARRAARATARVDTCVPVPAPGGERVVPVATDGLGDPPRRPVRVPARAWSRTPRAGRRSPAFELLGAITARMHEHARAGTRPAGFTGSPGTTTPRSASSGYWGRWQDGMAMGAGGARGARPAGRHARGRGWRASAPSRDRYGLVHADLRLANLLVDGGHVTSSTSTTAGLELVPLRLRHRGLLLRGRPARPGADRRVGRGYRSVRAARRRPTRPSSPRS